MQSPNLTINTILWVLCNLCCECNVRIMCCVCLSEIDVWFERRESYVQFWSQRLIQNELIFRLLLKVTVDWPHSQCDYTTRIVFVQRLSYLTSVRCGFQFQHSNNNAILISLAMQPVTVDIILVVLRCAESEWMTSLHTTLGRKRVMGVQNESI